VIQEGEGEEDEGVAVVPEEEEYDPIIRISFSRQPLPPEVSDPLHHGSTDSGLIIRFDWEWFRQGEGVKKPKGRPPKKTDDGKLDEDEDDDDEFKKPSGMSSNLLASEGDEETEVTGMDSDDEPVVGGGVRSVDAARMTGREDVHMSISNRGGDGDKGNNGGGIKGGTIFECTSCGAPFRGGYVLCMCLAWHLSRAAESCGRCYFFPSPLLQV